MDDGVDPFGGATLCRIGIVGARRWRSVCRTGERVGTHACEPGVNGNRSGQGAEEDIACLESIPGSVPGQRAVELQGACRNDSPVDTRREFVGDEIMDGGTCYFTVFYFIGTGRYSNVLFHGYA